MTVAHGHAENHCIASLWYQPEPNSVLILMVEGEKLRFGRRCKKREPYIMDIDVAALSQRLHDPHCCLWFIRKEYVLYNLSRPSKTTFLAREVKDREPKAGDAKVETADITMLLSLQTVEVDAQIDLSQDFVLLGQPDSPRGQILIHFKPTEKQGEYDLVPLPCKVLERITK